MDGRASLNTLIALGSLIGLTCCGFAYDGRIDDTYRLVAVDVPEEAMLCRRLPGGDCVGDGLPSGAIFAAGANTNYVVVARYPKTYRGLDRSAAEYFYVTRHRGDPPVGMGDVVGPMTKSEFDQEVRRLGLPSFSHRVRALE